MIILYYLLLWIGYSYWPAAICNRLLSIPWEHDTLTRFRIIVHDLPLLAGPFFIYYLSTIPDQSLELSSFFHPTFKTSATLFCLLGAINVVIVLVQNLRQQYIANLLSHKQIIESIKSPSKLPSPTSLRARIARLPLNESLRCEFNHKTLDLLHLPAELNGLSILHISDVHLTGHVPREFFEHVFDRISQQTYDLAIFSGDLLDNQDLSCWLETTFQKIKSRYGNFFILGNHDWNFTQPRQTRELLTTLGWQDIASVSVSLPIHNSTILLAGTETPWLGQLPTDLPAPDQTDFRILVSHTPDNIRWAQQQHFDLMLSGHNHGGQIRFPLLGPVYSPSSYGVKYACGLIDERPTLIHISRGLSAAVPLRINCCPEVTLLTLRSTHS